MTLRAHVPLAMALLLAWPTETSAKRKSRRPRPATAGAVETAGTDPLERTERYIQGLFDEVADSVVFIANGKGFGSGFAIDPTGLVLTNAHVVGDASEVDVVLRDGRRAKARVVEKATANIDLALIRVPVNGLQPVELNLELAALRVGSWAGCVSHGEGGIWTFNTGMVSNIYPGGSGRPVFQTQIPLNPGSSGGPIFDRQGRVVGIVTAGMAESNSINFAIKIDVATRHLQAMAAHCECLTVEAPTNVPIFVDNQMVGSGPHTIVPVSPGRHEVFAIIGGKMVRKSISYPEQKRVVLSP